MSLQDILAKGSAATDASGNAILADVGLWMRDECKKHFKVRGPLRDHQGVDPAGGQHSRGSTQRSKATKAEGHSPRAVNVCAAEHDGGRAP
jgi:hypothetical protein